MGSKRLTVAPKNVVLPTGSSVVTRGLQKQQFNGKYARVEGYDEKAGRYAVQIAPGKRVKMKLENVRLA